MDLSTKATLWMTTALSASLWATGCGSPTATTLKQSPKSEYVTEKSDPIPKITPQGIQWIHVDGGQRQLDFNPKIDVLFVIDDSDSMKSHQENLVRNINRFTDGFQRNKGIDYHIGVTAVWDSTERALRAREESHAKTGRILYANGELRPVKDATGKLGTDRFVTRTQDANLLATTLHLGVTPYKDGGPEIEELFSPISEALKLTGRGAPNEGFFRSDAHLAVVLVTDADDSRNGADPSYVPKTSPSELANELFAFKNNNQKLVSVWGVLVSAKDPDSQKDWDLRITPRYNAQCFDAKGKNNGTCHGFGPVRNEELIVLANPEDGTPEQIKKKHIMDIVQPDFGTDLLRIGGEITRKVMAKEILLEQVPRLDDKGHYMIRVFYGTEEALAAKTATEIPSGTTAGWTFNPEHNAIEIAGDVKYNFQPGARFDVLMVPVDIAQ